ncbi:MAG: DUF362 domain-containing protein [Halanaerobiales bacterium]|nr:DUF362 domain-containing protein [Halanaerobiales bacterium]
MKNTVAMAKCYEYDQKKVDQAVNKVIDHLGGIENFVKPGDKVLLKPNLVSPLKPEKMATTHPAVLEAICKILKKVGAEIWIGDSGVHGTSKIFTVTGVEEVAKKYDCKICDIDRYEIDYVINEENILLKRIPLSKYITEADVVINIPKVKIHAGMVYTGAVKNLYGTIVGKNKSNIHGNTQTVDNFNLVLLDILNTVKPQLTIMDGIVGMEGNGPTNGSPKQTGMILASQNPTALDLVAIEQIGLKLKEIGYLVKAVEYDFSPKRNEITVVGDDVPPVKYKHPSRVLVWLGDVIMKIVPPIYNAFLKPIPVFKKDSCTQCKLCLKICPVNAITIKDIPEVDKKKCISCFCCHEACLSNAIIRSDEKKKKK